MAGSDHAAPARPLALGPLAWTAAVAAIAVSVAFASRGPAAIDLFPGWFAAHAFVNHAPAYVGNGSPLPFIYPPSFMLLLAPLGLLPFPAAREVFLVVNVVCIAVAAVISLRMFAVPPASPVVALLVVLLLASTPVLITLGQGNPNGLLLLGECCALYALTNGRRLIAGLCLGLTLAIKPILAPLLLIPSVWRRLDTVLLAAAVVALPSAVVLLAGVDGSSFFTRSIPYMLGGESGLRLVNTSLAGTVTFLGIPAVLAAVARALVVLTATVSIITWIRESRLDPQVLAEQTAVVVLAAILAFSFSSEYHAIYLLPLVASGVRRASPMRHPILIAGLLLVASPHLLLLYRLGRAYSIGPALGTLSATAGFVLMYGFLVYWQLHGRLPSPPGLQPADG